MTDTPSKLVVIIQCDDVLKRCSGFLCMNDFFERKGKFTDYPEGTRYMSITCGGCCGNITVKLENLSMRLRKANISKDDVIFHFASCICSENAHRLPCPFMNRMKSLLHHKGFGNIVLGTHISQKAEAKRQTGIYRKWE